jgi:hypothetical protein
MSKSNYLENKMLDHRYGGSDYTRPATVYFSLHTADPGEGGAGAEVGTGVWTNYARVAKTNNSTNFPAASGGTKSNGTIVDFGTAAVTGGPPTVTHVGIWDAASGGNLMDYGPLNASKVIQNGDPVSFPVSALSVSED